MQSITMAPTGKLVGKVALVAGGTGGIGGEICRSLASVGASVVIADLAGNDELLSSITSGGSKAIFVKLDLSQEAEVVAAFDKAVEVFGAVHIVVQVAAICEPRPMTESTVEDWDRIFAVNVRGTFLVVREAARRMGPGGRIITTSSGIAGNEIAGMCGYAATKAAIISITKTAAKEFGPKKITVNCIAPGPVGTKLMYDNTPPELVGVMEKANPLGRIAYPKDIAPVVQFLAGQESEWINGEIIALNGGGWST